MSRKNDSKSEVLFVTFSLILCLQASTLEKQIDFKRIYKKLIKNILKDAHLSVKS